MLLLGITIYSLSLIFQIAAAAICFLLFYQSAKAYRWAWLLLAIGLTLMIGRRVDPIIIAFSTGHFHLVDAFLSLPISGFLFAGTLGLKRLLLLTDDHVLALETLSQFDPLTKSFSRTEILYRLGEEIDRSHRSGHPFALMEMDIDYFKKVNDQYGHQVGDEVLINLIKRAKEVLRSIDSVGRIGGEEFLVLLPETTTEEAMLASERLRAYVAKSVTETSANSTIQITISIGVAVYDPIYEADQDNGIILNEIVKRADVAMYQSKREGRNRATLWLPTLAGLE
jgi:diguanylate cyclase (GGDEF)-like protein